MSKVIVIGGGASGLIASIKASEKHEVILLEGNDKCGKKILLTGNGKCNYWNQTIHISKYHSNHLDIVSEIITNANQQETLSFLEKLGIYPKIKNGYYYPYSNQATSIRTILVTELEKRNIKVIPNYKVTQIEKRGNHFFVKSDSQEIEGDKVILATGSCACPKTGSDGSGYLLAQSLQHEITEITPALVPLIGQDACFKDWEGVRCDSRLSLWIENQKVAEEQGEIQLTNYGISGICTFNLSGIATKNLKAGRKVEIKINFLPDIQESFMDWMSKRNQKLPNHTIEELLESIFPYQLMLVIIKKAKINREDHWHDLPLEKKQILACMVESFPLEIIDSASFEKAQVSSGGVSLEEINPHTMESKKVPGFYLVGEVLDVDGQCGGFNLAFAWISGYLAGKEI